MIDLKFICEKLFFFKNIYKSNVKLGFMLVVYDNKSFEYFELLLKIV